MANAKPIRRKSKISSGKPKQHLVRRRKQVARFVPRRLRDYASWLLHQHLLVPLAFMGIFWIATKLGLPSYIDGILLVWALRTRR